MRLAALILGCQTVDKLDVNSEIEIVFRKNPPVDRELLQWFRNASKEVSANPGFATPHIKFYEIGIRLEGRFDVIANSELEAAVVADRLIYSWDLHDLQADIFSIKAIPPPGKQGKIAPAGFNVCAQTQTANPAYEHRPGRL